ncbi:MAG: hypothetical protein IJZ89_09305 [Clostridia bacterium]|nr:hypothetical protein [Clostridia bacterium]
MKKNILKIILALVIALQMPMSIPFSAAEETPDAEAQASESEAVTPDEIVIPESSDEFLSFYSYQVRDKEYNGLRSRFKVTFENMPTLEKDGLQVIEYGSILASTDKLTKNGDELTVTLGSDGTYNTVSYGKLFRIFKDGEIIGDYLKKDEKSLEYACTVTYFSVDNFDKNVSFRGYAVLADAKGNEYVVYSDYSIESYRSANLADFCDEMLADGTINIENISYIHVTKFRKERSENEGWSPIWRPGKN